MSFEEGLRSFVTDIHAMGTGALSSSASWSAPDRTWRKREAYIALMRHITPDCENYRQWDCFRFKDFVLRQSWGKTFDVRHLPISNGKWGEYAGKLADPVQWSEPVIKKTRKRKSTSVSSTADTASAASASACMRYDVEKGCLVPY